ncbi:MAG: GTPase (G3E family) [Oscillospiraceae bacterium]|nr:GTPase (G3E family) [Oscillospiraceae bacterium]
MTKIDLITGTLGVGKTTFLRRYAQYLLRQGQRIAILENDFGAVNVDVMMLRDLKSENCFIQTVAGCTDPTCHRRRLRTQLIALGMQHFDRVLMEPSGIFDMDEFFDTLFEPPLDRWFEIGSVLTVVDAQAQETGTEQAEYLFASQAAYAGRLIVSKLHADDDPETVSAQILRHLRGAGAAIRCDRQFSAQDLLIRDWDALTDADFAALTTAGYRRASFVKQFHMENIGSNVHYFMRIRTAPEQIEPMIREIFANCGTIRRIKGALPVLDGWCKINATAQAIETEPVPSAQAVLIVIGDDVDRAAVDKMITKYNTDPDYVSI